MLEHVETMFDGMPDMMKHLKKAPYAKNMEAFRERNGHFFQEMTDYVSVATDAGAAADEIAAVFVERVDAAFRVKGKIGSRAQADLNFFMIFYVFPAILLTNHPCARQIADAVCGAWRKQFKDSNISYEDYDTIYASFHEKIFGIF